jgi:TfoX/Sxy family transcriptional regulator of competence genes
VAEEYLERLSVLVEKAASGKIKNSLECKHFFSGAAVYAQGRICMSLTPVGFAIKLPEESRDILIKEQGAKPLRYFPKGPIKRDYVVLPKAVLNDIKALRNLVKVSIEYVVSLPAPAKRSLKPSAAV